jgi:flagellar motor protein MotB
MGFPLLAQSLGPAPGRESQPIYRVTIVQRTTPAINYSHRSEPTNVDFRGTPLLPEARGIVTVESKRGSVLVDARFDRVQPPTRFGAEYLTYVVWAISPEGRAQNLGELVLNGSDRGRLRASTQMQAFALIVTAEPYFSVTQPSDVVVMENAVRPDTVGKVEQVNATYELLQRKEYTYSYGATRPAASSGPAVSMDEYEAVTAVFQAKNAIEIASAAGADRYAPERLARAERLFEQARHLPLKRLNEEIVSTARESAQIAEDARLIALKRAEDDRIAKERAQTAQMKKDAEAERAAAQAATQQARMEADRARADAAHAQAEAEQARAQLEAQRRIPPVETSSADRMRIPPPADDSRPQRAELMQRLNTAFETHDTPRGLVMVIPDAMLETPAGVRQAQRRIAAIAPYLTAYPGLKFEVGAYTDTSQPESVSFSVTQRLAARVQQMLVAARIPSSSIVAQAYGSSRPVASNATSAGRLQNRRVEIVITGDAVGTRATWDRPYSLKPR